MPTPIQPYTLQQLAQLYGISRPVMRKWLQARVPGIGERAGYYYTARQVQLVFEKLGVPANKLDLVVSCPARSPVSQAG